MFVILFKIKYFVLAICIYFEIVFLHFYTLRNIIRYIFYIKKKKQKKTRDSLKMVLRPYIGTAHLIRIIIVSRIGNVFLSREYANDDYP